MRILWRRRWPLSERISVVIVDDEIISRGYMELSIEPSRVYEVEASLPSADSALEWLEDNSAPDLLILDVMMKSGIDGLSAARVVRDKYPQMKIIIVTSLADTDWIGEARRIGVDAFWFKTYPELSLTTTFRWEAWAASAVRECIPVLSIRVSTFSFTV